MDKARNIELEIRMINAQIALAVRDNVNYNAPGPRAAHLNKLIALRPLINQDKFHDLTEKYFRDYVECFHNQVKSDRHWAKMYGEPDRNPGEHKQANAALERCRDVLRFIHASNAEFAHKLMIAYPLAWVGLDDTWALWTRIIDA